MRVRTINRGFLVGGLGLAALLCASGASAQTGFEWRRSGTGMRIPGEAYIGGQEDGTPLVVCRAPYLGGVYPGKLVKGNCNISYDSREIYLHDFDILVGQGGQWGPPQPGLAGAFVAGYERGGPLFLCQANYRGGLHPGKVYHDACDISYGGREIPIRRFSVFYIGAPDVATSGGAPYPPTIIYRDQSTTNHYYAPAKDWRADDARRRDDQQRADDQRNQQLQRDLRDRRQEEQQRAAYERHQQEQKAQQAAEEARVRAEGEAEENRQALKAQAQAEDEARRAEEIKHGEEEENRMAAEAQAKAQEEAQRQAEIKRGEEEENRMAAEAAAKAQEEAQRQAEIKQGEDEENRMAAEAAAKAQAESPPPESPPPNL